MMNWRRWLPFARKDNPVADVILLGLWGEHQLITPRRSVTHQAQEGYEQNVSVYACINVLARGCAGIPWVLMRRGKTATSAPTKLMSLRTASKALAIGGMKARAAKLSEIEDHPLLTLIERPNPIQGGAEYTESVFGFLLISGNSFETWVTPDTGPRKGQPMELWPLRTDRMKIIGGQAGTGQIIGRYEYWAGAGVQRFDPTQVLQQKFFAPLDDFFGLSPIQVAARVITGDNAAQLWNQRLLQNTGIPPGMLVVKGAMQSDARDRLKAELEARITGPQNARRPLVGEGDIDWKAMSLAPADLDWIEGRKLNRREIAQAYGVPPELIGDVEAQGYASKEQARKALYQETILPLMDRRRDNVNNSVTPLFGDGLYLDYDRDQIEALHDDTNKLYAGIRQADWLTVNEKRAATGYDEYKGDPTVDPVPDVPVMFLKPAALPGAPQDSGNPGGTADPSGVTGEVPPSGDAGALESGSKAQQLSPTQRAVESRLHKQLDAHFRKQARALAEHLRGAR